MRWSFDKKGSPLVWAGALGAVSACLMLVLGLSAFASAQDSGGEEAGGFQGNTPGWLKKMVGAAPALPTPAQTEQGEVEQNRVDSPSSGSPAELRHLTAEEAVEAAVEAFPGLVEEPADLSLDLAKGEKIAKYEAPNIAQLLLPNGRRAVAESVLPMVTETAAGKAVPVNLELTREAGEIEPVNPLVPLDIPENLREGIHLPESGVTLTPVKSSGAPLGGTEGKIVDEASAFFANIQADTDMLAKAAPLGFETQTILRSPASPETLRFSISAGNNLSLTETVGGSISAEVNGRAVATIAPVTAIDANGAAVPVKTEIEGSELVLSIDRTTAYKYPIAVDPTVTETNNFSEGKLNWEFAWRSGPFGGEWLSCHCLEIYNNTEFKYGDGAFWNYQTQGSSHIYEFDGEITSTNSAAGNFIGIAAPSETWNAESYLGSQLSGQKFTLCAAAGCAASGGSESNAAVYELFAAGTGWTATGKLDNTTVKIAQETGPSGSFNTTSKEIEGKKNALYNSQWVKWSDGALLEYDASDPGLGVKERKIFAPSHENWEGALNWNYSPPGRCLGVQCDSTFNSVAHVYQLAEGENTIEARVKNPTGAEHTDTAVVKVDSTAPVTSVKGLPQDGVVALGRQLHLEFQEKDGKAPTASSGLKAKGSEVLLDGKSYYGGLSFSGCSPGPCEATLGKAIITTSILSPGVHLLTFVAEDSAGNKSSTDFSFVVQSGPSQSVGPGRVNLADGEFTMTANDVSSDMAGPGLSVNRSYQSRNTHSKEGIGKLTEGWSLTLGGWRGITILTNGDAVLTDPRGRPFVFKSLGGGGFISPGGYQGWTLKEAEKSPVTYALTSPSGGITTFRKPAGEIFLPVSFIGPGGTEETTFEFENVSGWGLRPKKAIGPSPEGVSCTTSLVRGCRALTFEYADSTTATGESPSEWGDLDEYLRAIDLHAWDPEAGEMASVAVVQYAYDTAGQLRAVWDPRISPSLKTTYGYNTTAQKWVYRGFHHDRVASVTPPGQQPWVLSYGAGGQDGPGWEALVSVSRAKESAVLGGEAPPESLSRPTLSSRPQVGVPIRVQRGTWGNEPVSYSYQWERCSFNCCIVECTGGDIPGATHQTYTPTSEDKGNMLVVHVEATNAAGATSAYSMPSGSVLNSETERYVRSCRFSADEVEGESTADPIAVAASPYDGSIWTVDAANDHVQRFVTTEGSYHVHNCFQELHKTIGSHGSGDGQFDEPVDIAINESGETFVLDKGNDRVEVFDASGGYLRQWGTEGSGAGEFNEPNAITAQGSIVWVADTGNNSIEKFNNYGEFKERYGTWYDSGCTQHPFWRPTDVAIKDKWSLFVTSTTHDGIVSFHESCSSNTVQENHGESPLPSDLFSLVVGPNEHLFVVDRRYDRIEDLEEDGTEIDKFGGEGPGVPVDIAAGTDGSLYTVDANDDYIQLWTVESSEPECWSAWKESHRSEAEDHNYGLWAEEESGDWADVKQKEEEEEVEEIAACKEAREAEDEPIGDATTTIDYEVPVSGKGAPYDMSESAIAKWGQSEVPAFATAIFPPDEVPSAGSGYKLATIYYMDAGGRTVNVAAPGGRIETNEYDSNENLTRNLTPANRAYSLKMGESAAQARLLDTQYSYNKEGTSLLSVLNPRQQFSFKSKSPTEGRLHTVYKYTYSSSSKPLVTEQTETIETLDKKEDVDPTVTVFFYNGQSDLGLKLEKPTSEIVDPSGLHLETRTIYDVKTGDVVETTKPAHPEGGSADSERTVYYTAGESKFEECGNRPEWAGLVCRTEPGAQPETKGLPNLPVTTSTYNIYDEATTVTETAGEDARMSTVEYDLAGRPIRTELSASEGIEQPALTTVYDESTGAPIVMHNETESLVSEYDSLGRLVTYMDADGNTSTFDYDIDGRLHESSDGKGTQTRFYDAETGDLTKLEDSGIGTLTAKYNPDGKLSEETLPNGMTVKYEYAGTGAIRAVSYEKTTHCSGVCYWYANAVLSRNEQDKIREEAVLWGETYVVNNYSYDEAGRLTGASDAHIFGPKEVAEYEMDYAYDADTNLTSQDGYYFNPENEAEHETSLSNSFDEANRLIDGGVSYDAFGDVVELPATDAGGSGLVASYYADGTTASLLQNGTAVSYQLDPLGRQRRVVSASGEGESEEISHFSGSGDSPSWISDGGEDWTRYVGGIRGGVVAIQSSSEEAKIQISNLHGDVVGSAPLNEFATEAEFSETDHTPYGVPEAPATEEGKIQKYSWLGAAQRSTDLGSGVISMGARTYVPSIGRFLQPDPAPGGSPNAYAYTWGDPVNQSDLSGEFTPHGTPTWLRNMAGHAPALPPPPPPPVMEALEEAEFFSALAGGGFKMLGAWGSAPALEVCILPCLAKKFGQIVAAGGKFFYQRFKEEFESSKSRYETALHIALHAAKRWIEFKTGADPFNNRAEYQNMVHCARGGIENALEGGLELPPPANKYWVLEGCLQGAVEGG